MTAICVVDTILDAAGVWDRVRLKKQHWYTGGGGGGGGGGGATVPIGIGNGGAGGGGGGGGGGGLFQIGSGSVYGKMSILGKVDTDSGLELSGGGGASGAGAAPGLYGRVGKEVKHTAYNGSVPYNFRDGKICAWSWLKSSENWASSGGGGAGGQAGATNESRFVVWKSKDATVPSLPPNAVVNEYGGGLSYPITFRMGQDTSVMDFISGTIIGSAPNPGDRGKYFMGYYTGQNGAGVKYFDRYGHPCGGATIDCALELHAHWLPAAPTQQKYPVVLNTSETTLGNFIYTFDYSTTLRNVRVSEESTAVIHLPPGVTLTCTGSAAGSDGANGARPGIEVPTNSTLIVTGGGHLVTQGGDAGEACTAGTGISAKIGDINSSDEPITAAGIDSLLVELAADLVALGSNELAVASITNECRAAFDRGEIVAVHNETFYVTQGRGGLGGDGGGGAAPGIGGCGGSGGRGGALESDRRRADGQDHSFCQNGKTGEAGAQGANGQSMGRVCVLGAHVEATRGKAKSRLPHDMGKGGDSACHSSFKELVIVADTYDTYGAGGGGGGAPGGYGGTPQYAIGGGGGGGGGGGQGGFGGFEFVHPWRVLSKFVNGGTLKLQDGKGQDAKTYGDINEEDDFEADDSDDDVDDSDDPSNGYCGTGRGGSGGRGGAYGAKGGDGELLRYPGSLSSITLHGGTIQRDDVSPMWGHPVLERTITFRHNGSTIGTVPAQIGLPLPILPTNYLNFAKGYAVLGAYRVSGDKTTCWYGIDGAPVIERFEGLDDVTLEIELMPKWETMAWTSERFAKVYSGENVICYFPSECSGSVYASGVTNATEAGNYAYELKLAPGYEIWSDFRTDDTREFFWSICRAPITNRWKNAIVTYDWTKSPEANMFDITNNVSKTLGFDLPPGVTATFAPKRRIHDGLFGLEAQLHGGRNYLDATLDGAYDMPMPMFMKTESCYPWTSKVGITIDIRSWPDRDLFYKAYRDYPVMASLLLNRDKSGGERFADVKLCTVRDIENSSADTWKGILDLKPFANILDTPRTNNLEIFLTIASNQFVQGWAAVDLTAEDKTVDSKTYPLYRVNDPADIYPICCSLLLRDIKNTDEEYASQDAVRISIVKDGESTDWMTPQRHNGTPIVGSTVRWQPTEKGLYRLEHITIDAQGVTNDYKRVYFDYQGEQPEPTADNVVVQVVRRTGEVQGYATLKAAVADVRFGDTLVILGDVQTAKEKIPSGVTVLVSDDGIFRTPATRDLLRDYDTCTSFVTNIAGVADNVLGYHYGLDAEKVRPRYQLLEPQGDLPPLVVEKDAKGAVTAFKILVHNLKEELYYLVYRTTDLRSWQVVMKERIGLTGSHYLSAPADGSVGFYKLGVTDDPTPKYETRPCADGVEIVAAGTAVTGLVEIPEKIGGWTVVGIAADAFTNRCDIVSVYLPVGVTNIGNGAFVNCTKLTHVSFPDGLKTIGANAFAGCIGLKELTLPDGLETIGQNALLGSGVKQLHMPASVQSGGPLAMGADGVVYVEPETRFTGLGEVPGTLADGTKVEFWKRIFCERLADGTAQVIACNTIGDGFLVVPETVDGLRVTSVASGAFTNHAEIIFASLPDSVTSVGDEAFIGCSSLEMVCFGKDLTEIGACCFATNRQISTVRALFFACPPPNIGGELGLDPEKCTIYVDLGVKGWSKTWQDCTVYDSTPDDCLIFASEAWFSLSTHGGRTWDGTVTWSADGETWKVWNGEAIGSSETALGDPLSWRLYLRGDARNTTLHTNTYSIVSYLKIATANPGGKVACRGNIETLRGATGNNPSPTPMAEECYSQFFMHCKALSSAPAFPAMELSKSCYASTFSGCTSLTSAPALPARRLVKGCYHAMFAKCSSLVTPPELPALTMADSCYWAMFSRCTALKTAPVLPSLELEHFCYVSMFEDCSALETAPALPALTMHEMSYSSMFSGCTALKVAPVLPAQKLHRRCYSSMFNNCTSLETAPELPVMDLWPNCYEDMFKGCTALKATPTLAATNVTSECYRGMFKNCTALTALPLLPATKLKPGCYREMFYGCSGICVWKSPPGTEWRITASEDAERWNRDMLEGVSGDLTTCPERNTTYYVTPAE